MFVSIYLSTVSSSMPGGPDKQPTSRSSRQYSPPSNLPTTSNNLPQTMAVNAKEADKEKQGPIYQHRSDSSSFIGDKKRTAVHLSFAETGKTGICAQRSPLDHSLSKKTSEKVALCQELSRAASQGPKHHSQPNQSSSCNFLKTSPSYNCAMRH